MTLMEGEQQTIAPAELETETQPDAITTPEADEPERIPGPEEATEEAEIEAQPEDESIEIDWDDGKKYRIPKALEGGILKNKDYTTKTQEAAAVRKALEARESEIEQRLQVTEAELDDRASMRSIDKQLEAYAKLTPEDWAFHEANDPAKAQQAFRHYQLLKDQKGEVQTRLEKAAKERTGKAEQDLATRIQETVEHAKKAIPGWKPDTIPKLVEFAQSLEIPEAEIKRNWSPKFIDLLYRANIGDQLLKKQTTAPKLPNPSVQPLAKVTGKTTTAANTDLASADMEAYVAARKRGVGGKPLR